jgi:hypothetical protein
VTAFLVGGIAGTVPGVVGEPWGEPGPGSPQTDSASAAETGADEEAVLADTVEFVEELLSLQLAELAPRSAAA